MRGKTYQPCNVSEANGTDTAGSSVTAIAAPGVGYKLQIVRLKLSTLEANTITVKSASTVKDVNYMPATGQVITDYSDKPLTLGENEALVLAKGTANASLAWFAQYLTVAI